MSAPTDKKANTFGRQAHLSDVSATAKGSNLLFSIPSVTFQLPELTSPPGRALPRCREVPPANEMAYVALAPRGAESCAGWCTGDVSGRAERAASRGPSPQCHSSPHTASKGGRAKSCPILCDHPGHGSHLQHFQRPRLRPPLAPGLSARARPRTEPGIPSTRPTRA